MFEEEATALLARAWAACASMPMSAWDLAARGQTLRRQRMPLPTLERALQGLPTLLEVAGPPGAGKTQFCLHAAALSAANGGEAA